MENVYKEISDLLKNLGDKMDLLAGYNNLVNRYIKEGTVMPEDMYNGILVLVAYAMRYKVLEITTMIEGMESFVGECALPVDKKIEVLNLIQSTKDTYQKQYENVKEQMERLTIQVEEVKP